MKLRSLVSAAALALFSSSALAIVPIDVQPNPEQGWGGKVGFAFSGKSGNKDEEDYNVSWLTRHRKDNRVWLFLGGYNYGESNGKRDDNDMLLHTRWIERDILAPMWDLEGFAQWQYDDFKDLDNRKLIGVGARHRIDNKDLQQGELYSLFGAGGFYEEEERRSVKEDKTGFRGNFYAKIIYDRNKAEYPFKAYSTFYVQPMLDDPGNVRATATGGIEFKLLEKLSLAFEVEVEHDSDPFEDVDKTDTEYQVKLAYSFD